MKVILASKSPRRKELLDLIGIKYEAIESKEEEILKPGLPIIEQSKNIAYRKARNVFEKVQGDKIVIGADTIVVKNEKIYGKPKTKEDAKMMLEELKNAKHQVMSSLAILIEEQEIYQEYIDIDITDVFLKDIQEIEIDKWLQEEKALDRAGAYGIQDSFSVFVEKIEGNYTTVLGLPVHKLYEKIKDYNIFCN